MCWVGVSYSSSQSRYGDAVIALRKLIDAAVAGQVGAAPVRPAVPDDDVDLQRGEHSGRRR